MADNLEIIFNEENLISTHFYESYNKKNNIIDKVTDKFYKATSI
jgi:hypothetical protein